MIAVKYAGFLVIAFSLFILSCSKKTIPQAEASTAATAKPVVKKPVVKKAPPAPVAKVIIVNDSVAKKSFDGRLYYDVEGRRYWRNYDDGKYYLFNKSMYSNPAFKPH